MAGIGLDCGVSVKGRRGSGRDKGQPEVVSIPSAIVPVLLLVLVFLFVFVLFFREVLLIKRNQSDVRAFLSLSFYVEAMRYVRLFS
jgi:hypothetical protein